MGGVQRPSRGHQETLMPSALLKACSYPGGCSALIESGRCRQHETERERRRGSAAARGYDYRWSRYSQAWLRKHPRCGERQDGQLYPEHSRCLQSGRVVEAECTDHIKAVKQGGAFWDPANHQSLCLACNTAKANEREGGFGR